MTQAMTFPGTPTETPKRFCTHWINGKPLQEKSLDAYFNEADVPSKLIFSVVNHGEIALTWSGLNNKFVYSIKEDPEAADLPLKTRDNWLRSSQ